MKGSKKKKKSAARKARHADAGMDAMLSTLQRDVHHAVTDVVSATPGPAAVLEVAALATQVCDDVSAALSEKAFGDGDPRACHAGCSWCCYQMVTTSPPVVFFLSQAIESSRPMYSEIVRGTRKAAKKVRGRTARERLALRLACPFLADDGSCAVYPIRPLACRGWNTYDDKACRHSVESPDLAPEARVHVPQVRVAHAVESGVIDALEHAGLKAAPVELIGALAVTLEDETAQERWLEGEDVFAKVRPAPEQLKAEEWFAGAGCC